MKMGKFRRKFSKFLVAALVASVLIQPGTTLYASGIQEVTESIENQNPADTAQILESDADDSVKEENTISETSEDQSAAVQETVSETDSTKEENGTEETIRQEESSAKEEEIQESTTEEQKESTEAEETVSEETVSQEESSSIEETVSQEESSAAEETISQEESSVVKETESQEVTSSIEETSSRKLIAEKAQKSEEIFFNTGRKNYQVVSREDFFEKEMGDAYFEEDGSYTIQIPEENPFFPYEVQFTYNGKVTKEWFFTPDDSIEIGGHLFYIAANFDGKTVTQMSLNIAGDTVIVYPEEKEFTDEDGTEPLSLLPLKEVRLTVDLSSYTPIELTMVSFDSIFTGENALANTDKVVWTYGSGDDFTIVSANDKIDLSYGTYDGYTSIYQMIVKEANQLAGDNIRYIVRPKVTSSRNWLLSTVYVQDEEGNRIKTTVTEEDYYDYSSRRRLQTEILFNQLRETDKIYISLKVDDSVFSDIQYKKLKIYEGKYTSASEAIKGTEITDKIYNADMTQIDRGYLIEDFFQDRTVIEKECEITFVAFDEMDQVVGCLPITLDLTGVKMYVTYEDIYEREGAREVSVVDQIKLTHDKECSYVTYILYKEYAANSTYYQKFYCSRSMNLDNIRAYIGQYTSILEAENADAEEISYFLFGESGYEVDYSQEIYITVFVGKDEDSRQQKYNFCFKTQTGTRSKYIGWDELYEKTENGKNDIVDRRQLSRKDECQYITYILYKEYKANGNYYQGLYHEKYNAETFKAYLGQYSSISEATNAGAKEIGESLFGEEGYAADYSKGVYFTVFIGEDNSENQEVYKYCFKTQTGTTQKYSLSSKTSVSFSGIRDKDGKYIRSYSVSYSEDSYSEFNYLTILVEEDVDLTSIAPIFSTADGITLYAKGSSSPEISGESIHDFSKGAVQYTASAENGIASRNYWLQIVKPSSEKNKLYINSLEDSSANTEIKNNVIYSKREVNLDGYHDYTHDILLVNIGTDAISSLSVELISDVIELDDYWTLNGKYNLEGFHSISRTTTYGELENLAKIRVKAKDNIKDGADISGTLIIKSNDAALVELTLTGTVGDPCIVEEIPEAVKYVPYGTMIQNNNKYSWNQVTYTIVEGELPPGMELKSNGELYGVPLKAGEFPITLEVENSSDEFDSSLAELVLVVKENTNANVYTASDNGYIVEEAIGTEVGTYDYMLKEVSDQLFVSSGEYSEFIALWLNGEQLVDGEDYTKESGSTRITIRSQTFEKKAKNGTNTIAAEFRVGGDENKELKRTAQNFRLNFKNNNDSDDDDDDDDDSSSGSSGSSSNSSPSGSSNINTAQNNNENKNQPSAAYNDDSWIKDENGWQCKTPTGSKLSNTWFQLPYKGTTGWYYFNEQGYMATGWLEKNGQWYYLNPISDGTQGMMCSGWQKINGRWCYFNQEGALVMNTWYQIPYLDTTKWYYFDDQGYMADGWILKNQKWYYLSPVSDQTQGMMCTGWQMIKGKWYYLNEDGDLAVNTWIDHYYVNFEGVWVE